MRRTKLFITVGPASATPAVIDRMLGLGVDAFRVNFSHGTDEEHRATLRWLRSAGERSGRDIATVGDLQGPKIRIGEIAGGAVHLDDGQHWTLDDSSLPGDARRVSVPHLNLRTAVRAGDPLLLGDGSIEMTAVRSEKGSVLVEVQHGGVVSSRAGLFLPRAHLRTDLLEGKDLHDLEIALSEGVDFLALSFVRAASEIRSIRTRLQRLGKGEVGLIAKIERAEALAHIDGILDAADGIMIARGDLGIEVPLERMAVEQKRLVAAANAAHKPVVVATQMLLSMVDSPRPTRAEATDVANAVLDGADAVMLSEESAVGRFPVESVAWLDRICRSTEEAVNAGTLQIPRRPDGTRSQDYAVADAAVRLSNEVGALAIVTPTRSGRTARLVAARRPAAPILAVSAELATRRRLALSWGVEARACPSDLSLDQMRALAEQLVAQREGGKGGGQIVLTAGYPLEGRPTNLVTVLSMGRSRGSTRRGRSPEAVPD
ncbi:MAG: pyruvate kinase [Thermoplasmata archaeon]|nr:pyruvate kinase [Thermoplasmata archaeon]